MDQTHFKRPDPDTNPPDKREGYKRIPIGKYGSARVSKDCPQEVIEMLEKIAKLAYGNSDKLID